MPDLTRDEIECLQRGNAPDSIVGALCTMALRAIDAESALAAAREALPTESTQSLIHAATRGLPLPKRGTEQVHAWLARLDAFRAEQAKATEPGECPEEDCVRGVYISDNGLRGTCATCRGTGKRKGGEHG